MNTQQRLQAIADADPCYKIATVGELQMARRICPGDLDQVNVLKGNLSESTFIIYYDDGEYVDLHEAHEDYDELVATLFDFLECDC